jgi:Haloacid Dehalogenase superfamily, subfamily IB, phosphoserine phosphatase-like
LNRFNSVVFDVDSTLSDIEGIDWLAALRGPEVQAWSAGLTESAMEGKLPIEKVYGERMRAVKPTMAELQQLSREYIARIAPGALKMFTDMQARGIKIVMVSGGLRESILPLARKLGVDEKNVHAVSVFFDDDGGYAGFDEQSLLTQQTGKRTTVRDMSLKGPILAVGDGMTDSEIKPVVDAFAAFTEFTRRQPVIERADFVIENFDQLRELILE